MLLIFCSCMFDDLPILERCCYNVILLSKVTPRILTVLLNHVILVPTCSVCFFRKTLQNLTNVKLLIFSMILLEFCKILQNSKNYYFKN